LPQIHIETEVEPATPPVDPDPELARVDAT
jgi:hypothetical protein